MTLQLRLTLIYGALAVAAVAILGVVVYVVAAERLHNNLDRSLEANLRAVEATLVGITDAITTRDIEIARLSLDRQALDGAIFQVRAPDGTVLVSSEGWQTPLPFTLEGEPSPGFRTVSQPGGDLRALVQPVVRAGQTVGFVETRTSLDLADASLDTIRNILIAGGLVVSVSTALAAFYVSGRAVKPVVAAASLAREIEETADFTRRLPEDRSTREMAQLTETFNRMVARVERMVASQRRFLSDTSHELRRPLTLLKTDLDVLGDANLPDSERSAVEQEMRSAADSMSNLVTELLVLARTDEMNLGQSPVNISEVCEAVVATARQVFPRHRLETEIASCVWVSGDEQALARAVGNVVQNAATYSQPGTRVSVFLAEYEGEVRLRVVDEGPGMSADDIEHAFERFYRGPNGRSARPDGLGLGLAIVKQVIEAHQGRIAISSSSAAGTTVAIGIPAIDAPVP